MRLDDRLWLCLLFSCFHGLALFRADPHQGSVSGLRAVNPACLAWNVSALCSKRDVPVPLTATRLATDSALLRLRASLLWDPEQPLSCPHCGNQKLRGHCMSCPLTPSLSTAPLPAVIDKAVSKGVLHINTAARRKARLARARQNVLIAAGLYTPAQ